MKKQTMTSFRNNKGTEMVEVPMPRANRESLGVEEIPRPYSISDEILYRPKMEPILDASKELHKLEFELTQLKKQFKKKEHELKAQIDEKRNELLNMGYHQINDLQKSGIGSLEFSDIGGFKPLKNHEQIDIKEDEYWMTKSVAFVRCKKPELNKSEIKKHIKNMLQRGLFTIKSGKIYDMHDDYVHADFQSYSRWVVPGIGEFNLPNEL